MALDKAALLAKRATDGRREVELPSGGTVIVRGLTRKEALSVENKDMDEAQVVRVLLSLAMIEPAMTEDEIGEWQAVAPAGDLVPVAHAILDLSGMTTAAAREAMASFRG